MNTEHIPDITSTPTATGKVKPDCIPVVISMAILTGIFVSIQQYFFRTKE